MAETSPQRPKRASLPYIVILLVAALAPLTALRVLKDNNVPLGRPDPAATPTSSTSTAASDERRSRAMVYPYTAIPLFRLRAALPILPFAGAAAAAVVLAGATSQRRRRLGLGLGFGTIAICAYWSYVAPPEHISQHLLTLQSPSHDGAFVWESRVVDSIPRYLSKFPERARTSEEEMWGTRVISNPPLSTVLAVVARRAVHGWPALREFAVRPFADEFDGLSPSALENAITAIVYAWMLTVLWAAAGVTCYALGRLFLTPPAALTFAFCCVVSPMTLLFTPGKDPAQLLSISVGLYLWLATCLRPRAWLSALAGVVAVFSAMMGLIHIWIGLIALGATALHALRVTGQARLFLLRCVAPGVAGVVATIVFLQVTLDWNVIAIILAVTQSQSEVTRGPASMPLAWQALGIPLFLLFAGPALWSAALWQSLDVRRDANARLGLYFQLGSALAMVATVGFTNIETPRLWIAFVPLLLLGAAMRLPPFFGERRFGVRLMAALCACQLASSALQWTFMDMRETEMRIAEQRFFD